MPAAANQALLDHGPWVRTLSKTAIDPDGLDLVDGGAPFYASLGEVSTSVMRATQLVIETLRDATDAGGGNLRTTQTVTELLIENSETIYVTSLAVEQLYRNLLGLADLDRGNSWMVFDEVNHLDVRIVYGDTPTSAVDKVTVLNGANIALWGDELLQFRDVASLGGDMYRLSCLLRGRFGTEWAMNTHQVGDQFILLTSAAIRRFVHGESNIGQARFYRAVTLGATLKSAVTRGFANYAVGLKPYAPCRVQGSRDGSDNLTITWYRRSRLNAEWRDAAEISIGEDSEAYEVEIFDATGTLIRTITGLTSASASYTAAQQTTDFGSPQSVIVVAVYQLSTTVGRGYGTRAAV